MSIVTRKYEATVSIDSDFLNTQLAGNWDLVGLACGFAHQSHRDGPVVVTAKFTRWMEPLADPPDNEIEIEAVFNMTPVQTQEPF
jgi:hypothetical protein